MRKFTTAYVKMFPRQCQACWECVDACPKDVIGRVNLPWHKHVVFKDADACIGCGKCIKTCPHGVFSKLGESSSPSAFPCKNPQTRAVCFLSLTFVAASITGIGLHLAGHGTDHHLWTIWAVAHIVASVLWLIGLSSHVRAHAGWYKAVIRRGIGRKSRIPLFLLALFSVVVITAVLRLAVGGHAGHLHYLAGLLLILLTLIHALRRVWRL